MMSGSCRCSAANASIAARNRILAGKSFPPFGTYTDARTRLPSVTVTMRDSMSNAGCANTGTSPWSALLTCSETPEYARMPCQ